MARRKTRKSQAQRVVTKVVRAKSRSVKRASKTERLFKVFMVSAGYGLVRPHLSNLSREMTAKAGVSGALGDYTDEAVMLALTGLISSNTSGVIKDIAEKGFSVESFVVGTQLSNQLFSGMNNTQTSNTQVI